MIELPSDDGPSPSPAGMVFDPLPGPNIIDMDALDNRKTILRLVFLLLYLFLSHLPEEFGDSAGESEEEPPPPPPAAKT